jgi:hypothetical protein
VGKDEKAVAKLLNDKGVFKNIQYMPTISVPEKIITPDYIADGLLVEFKKVSTERSIGDQIYKGAKQVRKRGVLVLDVTKTIGRYRNNKSIILRRMDMNGINRTIIITHTISKRNGDKLYHLLTEINLKK